MKKNYRELMEKQIADIGQDKKSKLLLHSCCAPCSSYVLELLCSVFDITVLFYNPNIFPAEEHSYREEELKRLIREMGLKMSVITPDYDPTPFFNMSKGLEALPEGGERCYKCYELRLNAAAKYAAQNGFDFFTTTLSISPYKNAEWLNEIGERLSSGYGVRYLYSDFKKKDGYKRSIELSREYSLYRQDYCGCVFSKKARESEAR